MPVVQHPTHSGDVGGRDHLPPHEHCASGDSRDKPRENGEQEGQAAMGGLQCAGSLVSVPHSSTITWLMRQPAMLAGAQRSLVAAENRCKGKYVSYSTGERPLSERRNGSKGSIAVVGDSLLSASSRRSPSHLNLPGSSR